MTKATKQSIITFLFAAACLLVFSLFVGGGSDDFVEGIIPAIFFLLVIPVLYIKMILKRPLNEFGVQVGDWKKGVKWGIFSLLGGIAVFYIAYNQLGLMEKYSVEGIKDSFRVFFFYEIFVATLFLLGYELLFRGLILFSLKKKIGMWAVIAQLGAFLIFLLLTGSPFWGNFPALVIAIFSGLIVFFSDSLLYSAIFAVVYGIVFDALVIGLGK